MAKEMKSNFGAHRSKTKPGSGAGSNGGNSSSWGMATIPPMPNGHNQQQELSPNNLANPLTSPTHNDSNNSSIQSNSNSEYSDIIGEPIPILRQRQQSTPKRNFNYGM